MLNPLMVAHDGSMSGFVASEWFAYFCEVSNRHKGKRKFVILKQNNAMRKIILVKRLLSNRMPKLFWLAKLMES